ncbi:Dihydrolipoyllysine-residue succinyltransferase component of 2-oxoglutarate dehydrogenase complex [Buchnera aphidicola (Neophyllaphis podocarpi)]|uniref:dihydrolipoyllysine-residue succinyltransferase n=1 Tax=Buchnera aphidicola TaxID=9 RepID=UPI003463C229
MTNKIDILAPEFPESITEATVAKWNKKQGDFVNRDEIIVNIETDKVILEVPSPSSGILYEIIKNNHKKISSKEIIGKLKIIKDHSNINNINKSKNQIKKELIEDAPPSLRRILYNYELNKINKIKEQSINKKIKNNIETYINSSNSNEKENKTNYEFGNDLNRKKKHVPMSEFRKCISKRLIKSKNEMAMLTTFNECNMSNIIKIRKRYGDKFKEKYGIRLGFMSFFVKSVIESLKNYPMINAVIENNEIIYYEYFDINIAVSTSRGVITPVIKNADMLSIQEIEKKIKYFAENGNNGKISTNDLSGGNFTITNGGIFGSLLSTPIININQTAILGMHSIINRPIVIDDVIKIAPMMYLALSYDHRLIDGKEAVGFLLKIKENIEDTTRIILQI